MNKIIRVNHQSFYISPEDYLEGERVSPIKHEYRQGNVYAMIGAKKPHLVIASNLVLTSDIKVRLEEADCYYYPDLAVTCDERDINNTDEFILYPVLIIEVLSKSTEKFDRGQKFADYQTSPLLQEYVLIEQTEMKIECFRRLESGNWTSQIDQSGYEVHLVSVDFREDIASIYQKVPRL